MKIFETLMFYKHRGEKKWWYSGSWLSPTCCTTNPTGSSVDSSWASNYCSLQHPRVAFYRRAMDRSINTKTGEGGMVLMVRARSRRSQCLIDLQLRKQPHRIYVVGSVAHKLCPRWMGPCIKLSNLYRTNSQQKLSYGMVREQVQSIHLNTVQFIPVIIKL